MQSDNLMSDVGWKKEKMKERKIERKNERKKDRKKKKERQRKRQKGRQRDRNKERKKERKKERTEVKFTISHDAARLGPACSACELIPREIAYFISSFFASETQTNKQNMQSIKKIFFQVEYLSKGLCNTQVLF